MAKPTSGGSGKVTIPAEDVNEFVQRAVGLPTTFFVTVSKAKILADGAMEATYTFDNTTQPPPPV